MCGWVDAGAVTDIQAFAGAAEVDHVITVHVRSSTPPAVSVTP